MPDAIVEFGGTFCDSGNIYLSVNVCNLGEQPIPANMPVTFFYQDPLTTLQFVRSQFRTDRIIAPGDCESFPRRWDHQITKVYGVANYDLSGTPPINLPDDFPLTNITECNYLNNIDSTTLTFQNDLWIDIGDDVSICPNQSYQITAASNSGNYKWQDGSRDSFFTIFEEGTYWCCVEDVCGFSACDTIIVAYDPVYDLNTPPSVSYTHLTLPTTPYV